MGREYWMEITKEDKRSVIDHCYLTYFISGMVILIFGVYLSKPDRGDEI